MSEEKLIAQQALEIAMLKEKLMEYKEAELNIHNYIYAIGGPLNDNKLQYTTEQKKDFYQIIDWLPGYI